MSVSLVAGRGAEGVKKCKVEKRREFGTKRSEV